MIHAFSKRREGQTTWSKTNEHGISIVDQAEFAPHLPLANFAKDKDGSRIWAMGLADDTMFGKPPLSQDENRLPHNKGVISISDDGGKTWAYRGRLAHGAQLFIRTKQGTLIVVYVNLDEKTDFSWDESIHDMPGAKLPTYVTRSTDDGVTWDIPQKLHDEWTGANRNIIQTKQGDIVFTSMMMLHHPGRHSVLTYASSDDGLTWERSNIIDFHGIGHHGGFTEASAVELKDGRLFKLIRTNWGQFWKAYSEDRGRYWHVYGPSGIDASSAPGQLIRLASGRIALLWNRFYPEGKDEVELRGGDGQWSAVPTSNFREELSISFSDDECQTWSSPHVIARNPGGQISYPDVFEPVPGVLWITAPWTRFSTPIQSINDQACKMEIQEKDFT